MSILLWPRFAGGLERVLHRVLQPLQLTDVSLRHAEEIVELRDFLVKAGCEVRTGQALGQIAARLPRDRAFHRDLTSYVWVVIDRCDRISYSDLLGVLAIAAAGSSFAATADEDDAHCLLRFLMEARHSLDALADNGALADHKDGVAARGTGDAVAHPSIEPFQPARGHGQEVSAEPLQPVAGDWIFPEESQNSDGGRRGLRWAIGAGCVLVALLIGLWLKPRPAAVGNVASAPATTSVMKESVAPSAPPAVRPDERAARGVAHSSMPRRKSRVMPSRAAGRSSRRTPVAAPSIPSPAANVPPPVTAAAAHGPVPAEALSAAAPTARPPASSTTPPAPVIRAAGTARPAQTAAASGPSSAPPIPQASTQQGGDSLSRSSKPPIVLHRRSPGSSSAYPDDVTDVASGEAPPRVSAAPGSSSNGSAGAAHAGTVHATSLGAMASNLVYSPMPAYPAAASASHVQGEVKLSADVDRNGKVASVRVISGPPLLRDAALDAVQRWRYRPYVSSGGPIPMAAIEILDFQLP